MGNVVGDYGDLDHRFDSWPVPVIVSLADNWVGEVHALPIVSGGEGRPVTIIRRKGSKRSPETPPVPLKLKDAADALLYLGSRDSLTEVSMTRADLDGTPYGIEVQR